MKTLAYLAALWIAIEGAPDLRAQDGDTSGQIAQLRTIKKRMAELFIMARDADRDAQATEVLATPGGWWSVYTDVNHPEISSGAKAWHKPALLARAWADPAGRHYHSQVVMEAIERGLTHMQRFAYPGCRQPNNWWAWKIGMPMAVLEILVVTEGALDATLRRQSIDTLAYLLNVREELKLSGAARLPLADTPGRTDMNTLWHQRLCLELALVVENPAMAGKWAERAMSEIGRPGQGFWQADYSYKFHGSSPMWAYGRTFLADYGDIIELYRGTFLAPSAEQLDRFTEMAVHYVNGFLYRGSICPAMIGREITRGDDMYHSAYGPAAVRALVPLVRAGHPKSAPILRIIAREREFFRDERAIVAEQTRLTKGLPKAEPAPPVDDIFAYPDSDFLQITRPGWAMGIRMHSKRNRGFESINGENLQGWYLSHGSTFQLIGGNEWKGCWPTIDWKRLPGTTVAAGDTHQNDSSFAGVMRVSQQHAMAAVKLQAGGLTARKSWFVDGNAILCLGSQIAGSAGVETTLFNQPVAAESPIIVDGKSLDSGAFERDVTPEWIWLNGMGYVFPPGQPVRVLREHRTSDWTSVRNAHRHGAGEQSSIWYLTGVIRHSEHAPTYHYVILPHVTAEEMPALARSILARYRLDVSGAHLVAAGDWEACVLWEGGRAGAMEADRGCMVWQNGGKWTAVDPAWEGTPLRLHIGGRSFTVRSEKGRCVSGG